MTLQFDLTKRPYRHSYSSIKKHRECPRAYALSYISKVPDPPTAAMDRGTRLHKLAEDYMNAGAEVPVPYALKKIALRLYQMREHGSAAEAVWLLDHEWEPVEDQQRAKVKAVIDVHKMGGDNVLRLHDYKSGREYASHADQLELYAAVGLRKYRDADRAEASAIYIDTGHESPSRSIIRDMLPYIIGKWQGHVERVDNDHEFLPTPGGHCERCAYASKNGGPCDAWMNI